MLHRVLSRHLGPFLEQSGTDEGRGVPRFVERELRRFLACGDIRRGFARVHCDDCHLRCVLTATTEEDGVVDFTIGINVVGRED